MSSLLRRPALLLPLLALVALAAILGSLCVGSTASLPPAEALRGALAAFGLSAPLDATTQTIVELRLWRALVGAGVGSGLALSGALLQGVFRNELASPAVIGVSSGASVGAALAILVAGGMGPDVVLERAAGNASLLVTFAAFAGALGVCLLVTALATSEGRVSVPTLLLVGVAINAMSGGILAAIQSFALRDYEVARAIMTWTFGQLDDRYAWHAGVVWACVGIAAAAIPFVALELDLFAGGEEDAEALGVHPARTKLLALAAAALAAGVAVSVAGQIAFVGLVVPHLVRLAAGSSHRRLLPLCLVAGPAFLMGTDLVQRALFGARSLPPGVSMSLIGGPFFLWLLFKSRARLRAW
jgi:iron complex transport system permease protein